MGGAAAITRLSKHDVQVLMASYDADPVGALTTALAKALGTADEAWPALVARTGLSVADRAALLNGEPAALDALAQELNELRELRPRRS